MRQTAQEIFEKYEIRKTKKQKTAFIDFITRRAAEWGYPVKVEKGAFGVRNIVVGDVETAKIVFTAHYDTCPVLPFPNFISPNNIWLYILYQMALLVFFFAAAGIIGFTTGIVAGFISLFAPIAADIAPLVGVLLYWGLLALLLFGPANKHTANDNTSGVTTLTALMESMPQPLREKVCFVFFDQEETGLIGSGAFARKHKKIMKNKPLLNFDCVSDGEHMLFVLKKKAVHYAPLFEKAFPSTETMQTHIATKGVFYPSDQAKFPLGIAAGAFHKTKGKTLYLSRIHTPRDTVYEEQNIEFLVDGAIRLAKEL